MGMRPGTNIISVFGQIRGIVADRMAAEGKALKIERDQIPATARWNAAGEEAHCALVITPEHEREFDERARMLLA